jgi:ornithine decarboxylase
MTDRILEFPRNRREDGPCLALGHDVVRDNYAAFTN